VSADLHAPLISPTPWLGKPEDMLNVLMAWNYIDPASLEHMQSLGDRGRLLIDSGAFTAWKAGKPVQLHEYLRFLGDLPFEPWGYFVLDVIGDPVATRENFDEMRRQGFDPIPIFTRGEDLEELDRYYEDHPRVALGGLVGTKGNKGFVNGLMAKIGSRPCHWLGFNFRDWLAYYRPDSADSSSWSMGLRYGNLPVYLGRGRIHLLRRDSFVTQPEAWVRHAIERLGVAPGRLRYRDEWTNKVRGHDESDWTAMQLITYRSWMLYQADIERRIGTKYFMASSSSEQTRKMVATFAYLQEEPQA